MTTDKFASGKFHEGWQWIGDGEDREQVRPDGVEVKRHFSKDGENPLDRVKWAKQDVRIRGEGGSVVFEQKGVEAPDFWSPAAVQITAHKYFRGTLGTPERETSVRQIIVRVVDAIWRWGARGGYFRDENSAKAFVGELLYMLVHQMFAFNSPVWFNIGVRGVPQQSSACFINSVNDSMESILDLAVTEGNIFRGGSGAGVNLSPLRSSKEGLSGGGMASGPVSFMRGYDAFAGAIKSGGKTRRAAKMVILNADHPDIYEFVDSKLTAEKMAHVLVDAGWPADFTNPKSPYAWLPFQNANNSVRADDGFMRMATGEIPDSDFVLREVTSQKVYHHSARDILDKIVEAAHFCADPGMQFDSTIQRWNMVPNTARINATNPCSEFVFLDNTACNLGSLNLMKFRTIDGEFDIEAFQHAVDIAMLAQEILVGNSDYPTVQIRDNSYALRPLGLGYANLGALLMTSGMAYDSDDARWYAAAITALLNSTSYRMSAVIARDHGGPFVEWEKNRQAGLNVLRMHRNEVSNQTLGATRGTALRVALRAMDVYDEAITLGSTYGYRNSQVTVLAPTGTIGFMMDCDTTGVEPDYELVKTKLLVGGGTMRIVNQSVPLALKNLGYTESAARDIMLHVEHRGSIQDCPVLRPEHLPVFAGANEIHWRGHILMVAAVQPHLSGAVSKTINMPTDATVEDVRQAYILAWKSGCKAISAYRLGCKRSQPLSRAETKPELKAGPAVDKLKDMKCLLCGKPGAEVKRLVHSAVTNQGICDDCTWFAYECVKEYLPEVQRFQSEARGPLAAATCGTCKKQLKTTDEILSLPGGKGVHHLGCVHPSKPSRRKLPKTRQAKIHKFRVGDHTGYMQIGEFADGSFGEVFIDINKEGTVVSGLLSAVGMAVSIGVQYGVPLKKFVDKFSFTNFPPQGFTGDPDVPNARSLLDYVFRWIGVHYLGHAREAMPLVELTEAQRDANTERLIAERLASADKFDPVAAKAAVDDARRLIAKHTTSDTPPCPTCGVLMVRNGTCYKCGNCGETSGCS
jgi:ribonucleoside-diphosphate reductase alpha chain